MAKNKSNFLNHNSLLLAAMVFALIGVLTISTSYAARGGNNSKVASFTFEPSVVEYPGSVTVSVDYSPKKNEKDKTFWFRAHCYQEQTQVFGQWVKNDSIVEGQYSATFNIQETQAWNEAGGGNASCQVDFQYWSSKGTQWRHVDSGSFTVIDTN